MTRRSYTLQEIRTGTGFPRGARFVLVTEQERERAELIGLLRDVQTAIQSDDGWLRIEQRIDAVLGGE